MILVQAYRQLQKEGQKHSCNRTCSALPLGFRTSSPPYSSHQPSVSAPGTRQPSGLPPPPPPPPAHPPPPPPPQRTACGASHTPGSGPAQQPGCVCACTIICAYAFVCARACACATVEVYSSARARLRASSPLTGWLAALPAQLGPEGEPALMGLASPSRPHQATPHQRLLCSSESLKSRHFKVNGIPRSV